MGHQEGKERDVHSSLQRENDGVHVGQEVEGEGDLKKSQQPKPSQLRHLTSGE